MQLGSGIEFSDHREYATGDDLRYLDWNVYARHGDLLLKRFQEEQDLHVYLMVDCSKSMGVGDPPKFDLARQLTAALAYIALADLDRIAVVAYANDIISEFPVARGKARILALMKYLESLTTVGTDTNLSKAVQGLLHRGTRNGLVVVLSDLFDPNGFARGFDQLRSRRFEAHVLQLHDPKEADPKLLGDAELEDVENGSIRMVTINERMLRRYKQLFTDHQTSVRDYCRRYGLSCTQSPSIVPFDELVMTMMRSAAIGS
jgi:uncharacterized protein (DUF58 family)